MEQKWPLNSTEKMRPLNYGAEAALKFNREGEAPKFNGAEVALKFNREDEAPKLWSRCGP